MEPRSTGGVEASSGRAAHRLVREVNRTLVLNALREGGELSRVDLARRTRLSKPTVSAIVELLLKEGAVLEVGLGRSQPRGGRPPALLVFNQAQVAYAGVHLGAHLTHVAVADGLGRLLAEEVADTPAGDGERQGRQAARLLRRLLDQTEVAPDRLEACGVAVPHPDLDEPLAAPLRAALEAPTVVLGTTAAAALAEGRLGRATGQRSYLYLHVGRAVEAAVVVEARLLRGRRVRSAALGGSLSALASAETVVRGAAAALDAGQGGVLRRYRGALDAAVVAQAAEEGDLTARRLVAAAGAALGPAVAWLAAVLDPDLVVLGGPLARAGQAYLEAVRGAAAAEAGDDTLEIQPALLGSRAPLLGAVQIAVEHGTPSLRIVGRRAS